MTIENIDFAENLRVLIASKGWNQKDAAAKFGVSQANVSDWVNEKHEPSVSVLLGVADALGVSLDELLRAPGPMMREAKADYDAGPNLARWFIQLRLNWRRAETDQRARMRVGIELVWPNQAEDIITWLQEEK